MGLIFMTDLKSFNELNKGFRFVK